jgi:hypothetical protein
MIKRCYSTKCLERDYTYKNCSVCEEWHNFQNFAKWYDENYYQVPREQMNLDKDILHKGNKIYSPDNCVFVPKMINSLFTKSNRSRGKYPIGVDYNKGMHQFRARCGRFINNQFQSVTLGFYNTSIEAFNIYKAYKEETIKLVAQYYKSLIPEKLYKALIQYQVDVTD